MVSFPVESTSANIQWKEVGVVQQMIENGHILIRFKVLWKWGVRIYKNNDKEDWLDLKSY